MEKIFSAVRFALLFLGSMVLLPGAAIAGPADWAPAHGYRSKHEGKHHGKHHHKKESTTVIALMNIPGTVTTTTLPRITGTTGVTTAIRHIIIRTMASILDPCPIVGSGETSGPYS